MNFNLITTENYLSKGLNNDLIKAVDPTHGGKLHPVHIVDKNGHHRLVYKTKEEIEALKQSEENKLVGELAAGHRVNSDKDGNGTIVQIKGHNGNGHLVKVKFDSGKVTDRFVHNLEHINPLDETGEVTLKNVDTTNPNVGKNAESVDDEGGLDYEIYGTPTERLHRWDKLIKNFKEGKSRNFVVSYGTGGVGKTFSVEKQMSQELADGEAVKFSGGTTPKGFLEMLYKNRDKKIILDDFDSSYEDENVLALLAICSRNRGERIIKDPTSGGMHEGSRDIPSEFEFTGKIMSISNMNLEQEAEGKGNKAQYFKDLLVNSDRVNLKFSRKETWDLIDKNILHDSREMINGQANPNFGGWNPNLNFKDAYGNKIKSSDQDREELFNYFNEGDSWKNMIELSGRTLTKANAIRNYYKSKGEDWKQYADALLKKDAPELDINKRYDIFQSSLDMIGKGEMKSAVVADRTADDIIEYFKDNGFRRSGLNGGFEYQDEKAENPSAQNGSLSANKDMAVVSGKNITVKSLYETLWKHNGKVIVFDKTAKEFLADPIGQGILKGALDTSGDGEISWLTSVTTGNKKPSYKPSDFEEGGFEEQLKEDGFKFETGDNGKVDMKTLSHPHDLPEKFAFKGRCVFVVNSLDESPQPVNSRSMMANINTNPSEFIQRAKYLANHREKKNTSFSTTFKNVGVKEYREAIDYLDKNKDWVNPMYYSEEGLQKVMGLMQERGDYSEERHAKEMKKDLIKGFDSKLDKAFSSLGLGR